MGTVYDFLWDSDPASLKFIQAMQYDLITLGNHEFDYGPAKLATMINKSKTVSGFNIPIIASNTVFDGVTGTADDGLETLLTNGSIITTFVKTLPNGLKIGFIGLIGSSANVDSPNAPPVIFRWDYAGVDKEYVQGIVDDLRNNQKVNVVIALSHSGVDPTTDPVSGDDITLAQNITGIDIIASGHVHIMTPEIIDIPNTATPTNITHIICAGARTTNLAQLDFNVTENGVTELVLTNHTIDNTILGDSTINTMVLAMDTQINNLINPLGIAIADVEATMGNFALAEISPGESGLGNMIADSLRYAGTAGIEFTIGAFARGVIENNFIPLQSIAFADLFAMVPLGITTATGQGNSYPGYPLLKVYLTGNEIWDMCKFDALIIQYNAFTEDFVHLSGIQFTHNGAGVVSSVKRYAQSDWKCITPITDIPKDSTLYPVIIDSYVMGMLLSPSIQSLLTALGISVHPKLSIADGGAEITTATMLQTRLDKDPGAAGIQEYYAWSALLNYFNSAGGLAGTIPADPYSLASLVPKRIILAP
jgi:5'-nucleotidase/UDP-sugar diphosphatase